MYDKELSRGALVNALGTVAKLVHPLFFVFVTWMFGTEVMGRYLIATFILQIAVATVTSGYFQATIIFASPHADDPESRELYEVIADALTMTVGISIFLVLLGAFGAPPFVERIYEGRPDLGPALQILFASLPFTAIARIFVGATKAKMLMQYQVLVFDLGQPLLLLILSMAVWALDGGLVGLATAALATEVIVCVLALVSFRRHFEIGRTLRAINPRRLNRPMLDFAVPASLNMTFNRYLTRLDVTMLGAFAVSDHLVAFYGAAALITSALREIRLAFSGALAPIVARHHQAGEIDALDHNLGRVSRWTTSLFVPVALLLLAIRADILTLVDSEFVGDTTFMAVLLIPPFLSCAFGLAGNFIVFTRHNKWNLFNSVIVAALNTVLNWTLIPRYQLMGAAIATATSIAIVAVLQIIELYKLEGVRLRWQYVQPAYLAMFIITVPLLLVWDPAGQASFWARLGLGLGLAAGYVVMLPLFGHPEAKRIAGRLLGREAADA